MIINLKLPDSLYEKYLTKYGSPQHYPKMKEALEFFSDLEKNDRFFIVNGENRRKLEKLFDITINDQADLAKKCEKLAKFQIEDFGITFTADELGRFANQASFLNMTQEEFMLKVANEIKSYMLDKA